MLYGSEKGLLNIIRALKDDYDITVVLPARGPLSKRAENLGAKVKVFPLAVLSLSYSPLYYIKFIIFSIIDFVYFLFFALRNNIDIIYTNNLLMVFPCFIAFAAGKKHIWHIREFFSVKPVNKAMAFLARRFSSTVICQSQNIKDTLFGDSADKHTCPICHCEPPKGAKQSHALRLLRQRFALPRNDIIYEPIKPAVVKGADKEKLRSRLGIPAGSLVMSIVSRIHPLKGQHEFIRDIAGILKEKSINAVLLIAGDISPRNLRTHLYKRKIEKFIKGNRLEGKVRLLGFCEDTDTIYSLTDIALFPYKRNEPFGISLLEALSFSCRVFVNPNPGFNELLSFFKTRYNRLNIKELADIIKKGNVEKEEVNLPDIFLFNNYRKQLIERCL